MAHTYDTKNRVSDNANPVLVPVTPTAGATLLVVGIVVTTDVARAGGAPTFDGDALTQVGGVETAVELNVELWYLLNPNIGLANVSVPNTGALSIHVVASVYKAQAGGSTEFDVSNNNNDTSDTASLTVTPTVNGAVIVDTMGHGYFQLPNSNNRTLLYSVDNGVQSDNAQYALQAIAAAITFTWTTLAGDDWAMIIAAFKEIPPVPTGHPWFYERKQ